ncbi:MAG TPA: alkaline phosphatase D family protein [Acidobacteriota bacterium]|nr:alkaline phosphatase D family protein [Acidobacteriota bacterium]
MNNVRLTVTVVILALASLSTGGQQSNEYGHYAPEDAFIDDSGFAYYGSENPWNRRFFTEASADKDYKWRGQRQLLEILEGRPEKAVEMCERRLAQDSRDPETYFMLAVARTQMGKLDKALEAARQALAYGLPFGRFLAGPRSLLRPLVETPAFREMAAEHPVRLIHGPMLGCVTDRSAAFWVRTSEEFPVVVRLFDAEKKTIEARAKTDPKRDYTAMLKVDGLKPGTSYDYDVLIEGQSAYPSSELPSFRTFPGSGRHAAFRVGFGGCAGYTPVYERMWTTILSYKPDAFLLLGDNIYIDMPEMPGPFHDYSYYCRQSRPEFRDLTSRVPVYAIWDDHDCGIDDIWMGPYLDKPAWKKPMLDHFRNNWNNPGYGDEKWPGCWFSFACADVDFIMLDCRFYRTNPFQKPRTMLGPVQKAWLFDQLKKSKATFKVIVSSVAWAPGAKPGAKDIWEGFPEEREEIFSFIEKHRIDGVFLLSGDRHRSDAWRLDRPNGYPLYDFMSSRLTNIHTHEVMPGALFAYNEKCSFGLLSFDTTLPNPEVIYQIVNIDGEIVHSIKLKRSQLEFGGVARR